MEDNFTQIVANLNELGFTFHGKYITGYLNKYRVILCKIVNGCKYKSIGYGDTAIKATLLAELRWIEDFGEENYCNGV